MSQIVELDDDSFNPTIEGKELVLVDFYADWCGPCKVIAPVIEELAKEFADQAVIAKVDVSSAEQVTTRFDITAVPTLIIFHGGKEVQRFSGITMKGQLVEALQKYLKCSPGS